ncbi:hypothetical protein FOZ63_026965 [Perkinsus olseni]|uniref:Uncharacterized protein n=1 Tax=Perkinsus olseni TaxID=32597 RepID=A0A7J6RP32_PEROL|nr:hypothetical protein FOZ63_026965 [Perkinsus olseni]
MRGGFGSVFSVSLCVFFSLLALAGTLLLDIILGYNSVIHWLALAGIEGLSMLFWIAFIRVKRQKVLWCFCACSLYSIILLGGAVITTITFIVVYPWLDDFSQSMCDRCKALLDACSTWMFLLHFSGTMWDWDIVFDQKCQIVIHLSGIVNFIT